MKKFKNFKVALPLVLNKPLIEHLKFLFRDVAAYFGINMRGWHDYRRYYYTPWYIKDHLKGPRLSPEAVDFVVKTSDEYLADYKNHLDTYSDAQLEASTQGLVLPLLREIMEKDPIHRRILDVGSCYSRVFRKIALEFPDFIWDMVDFPTNLEALNTDIATPGMKFVSEYPLDFVERTDHKYDIVNINRTLAWMGIEQIGSYLKALEGRARYIVFAEPCKILFEPGSLNIDAISLETPRCYHGVFFVHNYRALFEHFGYELIHYDADSSSQPNTTPLHFIIRGVAVPKEK